MSSTFLLVLDYGDVVYQYAPYYLLVSSDALHHGALRFITDCKYSTHHCELYKRLAWPSLSIQRKMHWYLLIYTAIMGYLPFYLCYFLFNYSLCSQSNYNLCVPLVRTELQNLAL